MIAAAILWGGALFLVGLANFGDPNSAIIAALMLAGFLFVNIPILDAHLHNHYGTQFDEYAKRTWKLVPFLY
jgi:protein-S-isoprenylcysteine O-methyltransferase Ste14